MGIEVLFAFTLSAISRFGFPWASALIVEPAQRHRMEAFSAGIDQMAGEWQTALGLIGTKAPPLTVDAWRGGPAPVQAGKVVLVRFWTVGCDFCQSTAPALADLALRYGPQGLVVIPVHHPKNPEGKDDATVEKVARKEGMPVPVAQDRDWRTIKSWWLTTERPFTSATILVDRAGVIRYFHPGGEFHRSVDPEHAHCAADRDRIEAFVQKLLAEPKVDTR